MRKGKSRKRSVPVRRLNSSKLSCSWLQLFSRLQPKNPPVTATPDQAAMDHVPSGRFRERLSVLCPYQPWSAPRGCLQPDRVLCSVQIVKLPASLSPCSVMDGGTRQSVTVRPSADQPAPASTRTELGAILHRQGQRALMDAAHVQSSSNPQRRDPTTAWPQRLGGPNEPVGAAKRQSIGHRAGRSQPPGGQGTRAQGRRHLPPPM